MAGSNKQWLHLSDPSHQYRIEKAISPAVAVAVGKNGDNPEGAAAL
jgi:hypothetical protein